MKSNLLIKSITLLTLIIICIGVFISCDSIQNQQKDESQLCNSISSIEKTDTDGLVDTYTITYSNGETFLFTVTNGEQGIQGIQGLKGETGAKGKDGAKGDKGEDGHTPVITIQNGNWYIDGVDTLQKAQGISGETGNGISDIRKTQTDGLIDTYTITFTNGGSTTFTVTNGEHGVQGLKGETGAQGDKGEDGHTPVITIQNGNWYIDGVDTHQKAQGLTGEVGNGISNISKTASTELIDTYTITFTNGDSTTFTVTNGAQGQQGEKGDTGADGKDGICYGYAYLQWAYNDTISTSTSIKLLPSITIKSSNSIVNIEDGDISLLEGHNYLITITVSAASTHGYHIVSYKNASAEDFIIGESSGTTSACSRTYIVDGGSILSYELSNFGSAMIIQNGISAEIVIIALD